MPIPKMKLLEILNRIPLFKGLSAPERERVIATRHILKPFKAGTKFINYGDMDDSFFILLAGKANVIIGDQVLAEIGAGDFVGEVGFICGERRTASVQATTDVIAMCITHQAFSDVPTNLREKIKDKMIAGLVARIQSMNTELNTFRAKAEQHSV